jgi:hypothetical protein
MDPVTGAVIAGVGGMLANRSTKASTARQMAFQERMSNTAHQRQMSDLKRAGINPMLSAKLGGASSPAGASYQASNIGAAAVEGYGKVSSAKQAQAQTKYISGAQTRKTNWEAAVSREKSFKINAETQKVLQDTNIQRVVHDERWPRLFSTMSAENVVASLIAAREQVPLETVLKGFPDGISQSNMNKIERMVAEIQGMGSIFKREGIGGGILIRETGKAISSEIQSLLNKLGR